MEKYRMMKEVGRGAYGSVFKAMNKQQFGEVVAIKRINNKQFDSWEKCLKLREVKSLRMLKHKNIVELKELIKENNILYLVFEYMECTLYDVITTSSRTEPLSETQVKNWCFQVFQGLAYMHQHGYFHRDLKPENLLVRANTIKIADFGLVRDTNSPPPYTDYVTTRWYRAPEVLLSAPVYGPAVDMWAMGAIMAELFTRRPLFDGKDCADQMYKICSVLGTPTEDNWFVGLHLARCINYKFPQHSGVPLPILLPTASEDAVSLIRSLCSWDPFKRPTALEALQHPFFRSCYDGMTRTTGWVSDYSRNSSNHISAICTL